MIPMKFESFGLSSGKLHSFSPPDSFPGVGFLHGSCVLGALLVEDLATQGGSKNFPKLHLL